MNCSRSHMTRGTRFPGAAASLQVLIAIAATISVSGCGSSKSTIGNTSVTLLASSTANDKLSRFSMQLISFTLTNQAGNSVTLLPSPQSAAGSTVNAEFMHVNGTAEPLSTVSIPQGVYTVATLTFGDVDLLCQTNPSTGYIGYAAIIGGFGLPSTTIPAISIPDPLKVTGTAMALSLNLQVSESVQFSSCSDLGAGEYSFTPTFNLTPIALSSQPTNAGNGKLAGLMGLISSIDTADNSFIVTTADGAVWPVTINANTLFQGVTGISSLVPRVPVDMDTDIQSDGSLLATRVAVDDTNTTSLTVTSGQLESVSNPQQTLRIVSTLAQGTLFPGALPIGAPIYSYYNSSVAFSISEQFNNLQNLPFTATFTEGNMVPGQSAVLTSHDGFPYDGFIPLTTVTLIPQTIDGTVSAVSSEGGFTTYTVALASYDLFPNMAVQPGQTTLLTDPGTVVVYADSNTQMLNSGTIGVGSVVRFNGLVFNDNGTLRMDCAQVNDGVPE